MAVAARNLHCEVERVDPRGIDNVVRVAVLGSQAECKASLVGLGYASRNIGSVERKPEAGAFNELRHDNVVASGGLGTVKNASSDDVCRRAESTCVHRSRGC